MDPAVQTSVTDQLLGQGILGVVVLLALAVIVFLQRKNDAQRGQIDMLNAQRLADRDLRLEDQKQNAKVMLEVADRYKETVLSSKEVQQDLVEEIRNLKPRGYR